MIDRDRIVLPDPDSPTTPRVLPRVRLSDTPSTARTVPRSVRKWVLRSTTLSRSPVAVAGPGAVDDLATHRPPSLTSKYSRMRSPAKFSISTVRNRMKLGISAI